MNHFWCQGTGCMNCNPSGYFLMTPNLRMDLIYSDVQAIYYTKHVCGNASITHHYILILISDKVFLCQKINMKISKTGAYFLYKNNGLAEKISKTGAYVHVKTIA